MLKIKRMESARTQFELLMRSVIVEQESYVLITSVFHLGGADVYKRHLLLAG